MKIRSFFRINSFFSNSAPKKIIVKILIYALFHKCKLSNKYLNRMKVGVIRGHSQTTLTRYWLFLTTYPPALTFSMAQTLTKSEYF